MTKTDVKSVLVVALGVVVAGVFMNWGYNKLGAIEYASDGFDK